LGTGGFPCAADCLNAFPWSPNMTGRSRRGLEARGVGSCWEIAFNSLCLGWGWIDFLDFGGTGGAGYCEGNSLGLPGTFGTRELDVSAAEGAGVFKLSGWSWVSVEEEGIGGGLEIESKDGSGLGAEMAVFGGWVAFASVS